MKWLQYFNPFSLLCIGIFQFSNLGFLFLNQVHIILNFLDIKKELRILKHLFFFYLMMISIICQVIIQGLEYRRFCFRFNQNLPSNSNPFASSIQKITLGRFKALFIFFKNPEILAFDIAARVIIAEICNNHESSVHNFPTMVKGQLLIWWRLSSPFPLWNL